MSEGAVEELSSSSPVSTWERGFAIFAVSAGSLILMADSSIASIALPNISESLHIPASRAVLVITAYQLVLAMTIVPFSALGDYVGQRRLYRGALLLFSLSGTLSIAANSLPVLLAIRAVQALSTAAALSVTFGLIRSIYPPRHLGKGLGLSTLCSASGGAIAPAIGGVILHIASWHWIFAAGVPLAVLSLLAGKWLPDVRTEKKHRFDFIGAILCAATFALVIWTLGSMSGATTITGPVLLVAATLGVGYLFIHHQAKQLEPVLPLDLLTQPAFALAVTGSLAGVVASTTLLYSPPFRLHDFGFGPVEMGGMVASYAVASFMIAPTAGMLSDRISPRLLGGCGLAIAILALALLALLPEHVKYFDVSWRVWLCGAGFALFLSPSARIVITSAPAARSAAAGGLMTTARMLGQALAATLVGALLSTQLGHGPAPALVAIAIVMVAVVCNIMLMPRRGTA